TLEELRYNADVVCTSGACVFPDYGTGQVIFIDGDYNLGPTQSGAGTLVVTGELTMQGRASWTGLILVVGEGRYLLNGAGNGEISGSLIIADIAGPDDTYNTGDDCTGGTDGFDTATFDENGGGNALTQYCSTDINVANHKPYRVVEFIQR
ncbi:MAG TPA: hypothetical protein VD788_15335, partial [Candidatus Polarisedimenticolaceae bacterium]|nr:hypothetical protein [Candidatus Polarisedimenticolaceae bacterium]